MTAAPVVVVMGTPESEGRARALAAHLGVPVLRAPPDDDGTLLLEVSAERLQLRPSGKGASGPVSLELAGGRVGRRRQEAGLYKTPLARAVGATRAAAPVVVDATAGLGTDSALLAWMGCRVLAVERSPVLAVLWRDALARLHEEAPDVAARLSFEEDDAMRVLARLQREEPRPDVVYLDPMFPPRTKTALVKKEMQILKALHGSSLHPADDEAMALLTVARATARKRVVVKRPQGAAPLSAGVTHAYEGSTTRLDVYRLS